MKPLARVPGMSVFTVLATIAIAFSNPVAPTQSFLLSEVQIVDPAHWTIELRCSPTPLAADTVTNKYYLVHTGVNPAYRPTLAVKKNGFALITQQQYPGVAFYPGDTVRLWKDTTSGNPWLDSTLYLWKCVTDKDLKPTQSMDAFEVQDSGIYGVPKRSTIGWCKDAIITLGFPNDMTGIWGSMRVSVLDKNDTKVCGVTALYPIGSRVAASGWTTTSTPATDANGQFVLTNLTSTATKVFCFMGISTKTYGPFCPQPACTLDVVCKLADYPPEHDSLGTLQGRLCEKTSIPMPNSQVSASLWQVVFPGYFGSVGLDMEIGQLTTTTDSLGRFSFGDLFAPCTILLTFANGEYLSGIRVSPDSITNVAYTLNNYTSACSAPGRTSKPPLGIISLVKQHQSNSVFVVFSGTAGPGDYALSIFSLSGRLIWTSKIPNNGSGTYSAVWRNAARAETYVARIRSQSATVERRFTIK